MYEYRANCPRCGLIEVPRTDITIDRIGTSTELGKFRFQCPRCICRVILEADYRYCRLLLEAGANTPATYEARELIVDDRAFQLALSRAGLLLE